MVKCGRLKICSFGFAGSNPAGAIKKYLAELAQSGRALTSLSMWSKVQILHLVLKIKLSVPITQWLECWSYEPEVEGSTPSRNINAPLAQLVERTTVNRDVNGSIPLRSVKSKKNI